MTSSAQTRPGAARLLPLIAAIGALYGATSLPAQASSHREAPFITTAPKVDGTDFYMFNSYEGVSATGTGGKAGHCNSHFVANDSSKSAHFCNGGADTDIDDHSISRESLNSLTSSLNKDNIH